MELKPGYKQTEVGVIPEEWDTAPCSEVSERIMVGIVIRPTQYYVNNGVPAFRSANIREEGINDLDLVFISEESNAVLAKSQTQTGDVLTVRTGYPGTSAVVYSRHEGCNCIDILITRPSKKLDSEWLAIWINSPFGKEQVLRNQGGLAQKHFNVGDMRNLVVALPPLSEQRAIAAALSDVDGLLGGLDRLIAKKRDLKQAAMQQLLTGQTRLPGFEGEWEVKRLGSLLHKGRLGGNYANQDEEAELPLMKMGNLARGYFDLSKVQFITPGSVPDVTHRLVFGDVLFNTRNTLDLVGKVAIWRDELPVAYYNSNLMRLEFDPEQVCSNQYANYALNTDSAVSGLRGLATGTTSVAAIYTRDLMKLQIIVPPLPEQTAIAEVLTEMDAELATLTQRREKTRVLKQAMMQELLTGRTRLEGCLADVGNGQATAQESHA